MPNMEVSLCDLLKYIGERSRPLKEGEEVFKAGHVILCGLEALDGKKVKALCLQTSSLTSQPHEITLELGDDVKDWKCVCSCKAGMSGVCKHIVATLIYVNRNTELEIVSCTELTQKWGKEKTGIKETYRTVPIKKFCHPKTKRVKEYFQTSSELDKEVFDLISTGVAESAITRFLSRQQEANRDMKIDPTSNRNFISEVERIISNGENSEFLKRIQREIHTESYSLLPCCESNLNLLKKSDVVEVATRYQQGSTTWSKERELRITGSTCYSIFTFKKNEEWENKSKKFFFSKHFTNKFVEHGRKYETEALESYKSKYGCHVVTPGLIICKMMPWLAFSPDGVIINDDGSLELLEIKCPYLGKENPHEAFLDNCNFIEKSGSDIKLKEKHQYYGQVQLGMALLGLKQTKFILYSTFSNSFLELNVNFDENFAKNLIQKITDNYFQNMIHFYCLNKK